MKRSKPLRRGKPLKRGKPLRSRRRIKAMSDTTRDQLNERAIVRAEVLERDRGCVAKDLVPEVKCLGGEDVDEIVLRSGRQGEHLDADGCQVLCRGHHDWKDAWPEKAVERGLRFWSWDAPPRGQVRAAALEAQERWRHRRQEGMMVLPHPKEEPTNGID